MRNGRFSTLGWLHVLAVALVSLAGGTLGACGGGGSSAGPAHSAHQGPGEERADATESEEEGPEEPAKPAVTNCDDGTCSPCGSGVCLAGYYCDEDAKGGPACGWLPECTPKLTCACVTHVLSGSSCEENGGSVHVHAR